MNPLCVNTGYQCGGCAGVYWQDWGSEPTAQCFGQRQVSTCFNEVTVFVLAVSLMSTVNSFRFSAALLEAARADKLIKENNGGEEVLKNQFPLLGVPMSVKESFGLQGTVNI